MKTKTNIQEVVPTKAESTDCQPTFAKVLRSWEAYAFSTSLDERNDDLCQMISELMEIGSQPSDERKFFEDHLRTHVVMRSIIINLATGEYENSDVELMWRGWQARSNIAPKSSFSYASTQATNCAGCGKKKHTPLRIDAMGGYVCLSCIDKKLGGFLGEFGKENIVDTQEINFQAGWKLVPIDATGDMFRAANRVDENSYCGGSMHGADTEQIWNAMVEAAPQPENLKSHENLDGAEYERGYADGHEAGYSLCLHERT